MAIAKQIRYYNINNYSVEDPTSLPTPHKAVAVSGDGSVYVFGFKSYENSKGKIEIYVSGQPTQTLYGSDQMNEFFGTSVDISENGNIIVVGAPGYALDELPNCGKVYIFSRPDQNSNYLALSNIIIEGQPGEETGASVAISYNGFYVYVGSPGYSNNKGKVTAYQFAPGPSSFGTFEGDADGDRFGSSIDVEFEGFKFIAGAPGGGAPGALKGYAKIFTFFADGDWSDIKVTDNYDYSFFGHSVSITTDGRKIVVGAPGYSGGMTPTPAVNKGRGFVYSLSQDNTSWNIFGDAIEGKNNGDWFGYSVAISHDGKYTLFGAPFWSFDGPLPDIRPQYGIGELYLEPKTSSGKRRRINLKFLDPPSFLDYRGLSVKFKKTSTLLPVGSKELFCIGGDDTFFIFEVSERFETNKKKQHYSPFLLKTAFYLLLFLFIVILVLALVLPTFERFL